MLTADAVNLVPFLVAVEGARQAEVDEVVAHMGIHGLERFHASAPISDEPRLYRVKTRFGVDRPRVELEVRSRAVAASK